MFGSKLISAGLVLALVAVSCAGKINIPYLICPHCQYSVNSIPMLYLSSLATTTENAIKYRDKIESITACPFEDSVPFWIKRGLHDFPKTLYNYI